MSYKLQHVSQRCLHYHFQQWPTSHIFNQLPLVVRSNHHCCIIESLCFRSPLPCNPSCYLYSFNPSYGIRTSHLVTYFSSILIICIHIISSFIICFKNNTTFGSDFMVDWNAVNDVKFHIILMYYIVFQRAVFNVFPSKY